MTCGTLLLAAALLAAPPSAPSIDEELARAASASRGGAGDPRGRDHPGRPAAARHAPRCATCSATRWRRPGTCSGPPRSSRRPRTRTPARRTSSTGATTCLQLRAYPPATDVLAEAVKRFPRSARLHVALGIARYSRGQFEDAIRAFCVAADLEPGDERPYLFPGRDVLGVRGARARGHEAPGAFRGEAAWPRPRALLLRDEPVEGTPGAAPRPRCWSI